MQTTKRFFSLPLILFLFTAALSVSARTNAELYNNSPSGIFADTMGIFSQETSTDSITSAESDSLDYSEGEDSLFFRDTSIAVQVHDELNYLQNTKSLQAFFTNLNGNHPVSVYHIGDSHIAGKAYPAAIAKYLHAEYGMGKTKIISPKVRSYKKGRRGRSGIYYRSRQRRSSRAVRRNRRGRSVKSKAKSGQTMLDTQPQNTLDLAFLSRQEMLTRYSHAVLSDAPTFDEQYIASGFGKQGTSTGLDYTAFGVNGKSFGYFAANPLVKKHLSTLQPDLVIVSLGINDLFGRRFESETIRGEIINLLAVIRSNAPRASILLAFPGDANVKKKRSNPFLPKLIEELERLAVEFNCAYWNPAPVFGGYGQMNLWYRKKLCGSDRIHLTRAGYTLMAEKLTEAIAKSYKESAVKDKE